MNAGDISTGAMLVCIGGPDLGKRLAITEHPSTIGRASSCEMASDDPDAIQRHAAISLRNAQTALTNTQDWWLRKNINDAHE